MIRHLLNPLDFSVEEIDALLDLSDDIQKRPEAYAHVCDGKKLATCFYEPSTRTTFPLNPPCFAWAEASWASSLRTPAPQPRVNPLRIPPA